MKENILSYGRKLRPTEEIRNVEKMFCIGLLLGMAGGALIVANNYKLRLAVKKGQQEAMDKLDEMLDKKLKDAGETESGKAE